MKINRKRTRTAQSGKPEKSQEHPGLMSWLSTGWNIAFRIVAFFFYKVVVTSKGAIPTEGSVLILAKHRAYADVPLGKLAITDDCGRHLWCLMKGEMGRGPLSPIFLRVGGIPVDRSNPEKSKHDLLHARKVLHAGDMLCIFPEQTFYEDRMGRGRTPGFRFIAGKPREPIAVVPVGFRYTKRRFRRTLVEVNIGEAYPYSRDDDPETFLHERMLNIAALSGLEYTFARPDARARRAARVAAE